jgi:protein phosphatase
MNEDQFLIADLNKSMRVHQTSLGLSHQTRLFGGSQGKLLLVADGLGGHESGERASTLAVDGITNYVLNAMDWVFQLDENSESNFELDLRKALVQSQEVLQNEAAAIPQRRGMATTLTMAFMMLGVTCGNWIKTPIPYGQMDMVATICSLIRKEIS